MPAPRGLLLFSLPAFLLSAMVQAQDSVPRVVATFSVLGDLVREVAGEGIKVDVLTPIGAEVHEWELVPSNFIALEHADVVFYNGYGLEQWIDQARATVADDVPVVALAETSGFPTLPIATGEFAGAADPHLWMDPRAAAEYAQVIAATLGEIQPDSATVFQAHADRVKEDLYDLHQELLEQLSELTQEERLLISCEAAFVYFANAFDFEHDGIWGNNAEEEGSPRQIMRIIDKIREREPAAIFWESTVSERHVRSVADETQVQVAGPLYVDSLSEPGGSAPDYQTMLRHNVQLLRDTLGASHD